MIKGLNPRHGLLFILAILVLGYVGFQARFLILGPQVKITYPKSNQSVESPLVVLEGTAHNVSYISLNGRQIFTDERGHWQEKLLVSDGLSIMSVEAEDRFGRKTEKQITIVFNQHGES